MNIDAHDARPRTIYIGLEGTYEYNLESLAAKIMELSGREERRPVEIWFEHKEDFNEFVSNRDYSVFVNIDVPGSFTDANYIETILRENGHPPVRTRYFDGIARFEFSWIS